MKQYSYLFLIVLFFLPALACNGSAPQAVYGSRHIISKTVDVSNLSEVSLDGSGNVYIEQGPDEILTIEADDNILSLLDNRVIGNRLSLAAKPFQNLNPSKPIIYKVTVKNLNEISLNGSGNFFVGSLESKDMKISIHGSGNTTLKSLLGKTLSMTLNGSGNIDIAELDVKTVEASVNGSGTITLDGKAQSQEISINGSGDYLAGDLETILAEIRVPGSGKLTVWVTDNLRVRVNGSGTIQYYGQPSVEEGGFGSGKVIALGKK